MLLIANDPPEMVTNKLIKSAMSPIKLHHSTAATDHALYGNYTKLYLYMMNIPFIAFGQLINY